MMGGPKEEGGRSPIREGFSWRKAGQAKFEMSGSEHAAGRKNCLGQRAAQLPKILTVQASQCKFDFAL